MQHSYSLWHIVGFRNHVAAPQQSQMTDALCGGSPLGAEAGLAWQTGAL
jgi:hypothetical protein